MKKLFYVVTLFLLISCSQKTYETNNKTPINRQTNPVSDPNYFIGKHKPKVMILGVFHFKDAGLDSYKRKFSFDILKPKRQLELDNLLEKIAKYKPTKILVEWNRIKMDSMTNSWYKEYLNNETTIEDKSNEVFQIGFKLAKILGHKKVYCSDATASWFGVNLDWDNYDEEAYLKSLGQYEKSIRYDHEAFYNISDSLKTTQTLVEHLFMVNNPKNRLRSHQAYLTENVIRGAGDNYLGADSVARWYRRNLRIFANAYDLTSFDQEERLLLIYGAGHVWQLRQSFKDSPDFDYIEEVNEYLK